MTHVQIKLESGGMRDRSIVIEGLEISHLVRDLDININPSDPARIVIELMVTEDLRLDGTAVVVLSDATTEVLERFGWTPPKYGEGVGKDE